MRTVTTKRAPGKQGRKQKKLELGQVSLKDLAAKDGERVKGGMLPFTTTLYTCK